jgi:glycosyltransferase involved in cell wall biosynthesis
VKPSWGFWAEGVPTDETSRFSDNHGPRVPTFGFLLFGGAVAGAQISHVRLANELVRRGYPVQAWWAMDWPRKSGLNPAIAQRWLFSSSRYGGVTRVRTIDDFIGRTLSNLTTDLRRDRIVQYLPSLIDRHICALVRRICQGVDDDQRLIRRFAAELTEARVTHVLPTLESLAPFAGAARRYMPYELKYLLTFQGYELYANFARNIGQEARFYELLAEAVRQSNWPAITVSAAYAARINAEIGISEESLKVIPPGVPTHDVLDLDRATALVGETFPEYHRNLPLVSYVGRRDAEKGLDLLLYAARILRARGVKLQLAICGPTSFGTQYAEACRQIATNLREPVLWSHFVSDEVRSAIFRISRAVVYPSIHAEPFGMVPVEAMAQGVPVVVPDTGGVAGLIRVGDLQAGLCFRSWDTGDLAVQLERLVSDDSVHRELAADAPAIAEHFSVERHGERVLDHLGLPHWNVTNTPPVHSAP